MAKPEKTLAAMIEDALCEIASARHLLEETEAPTVEELEEAQDYLFDASDVLDKAIERAGKK